MVSNDQLEGGGDMCVLFGSDPRCHPKKEVVLTHCWRSRRCEKPYNKLKGEGVCMCARKIGRDIVCERDTVSVGRSIVCAQISLTFLCRCTILPDAYNNNNT